MQASASKQHKEGGHGSKKKPNLIEKDDAVESSSESEDEEPGNEMERLLTFACLDNVDEKNKMELMKGMNKKTTKGLHCLEGVKPMARDMVRAKRQEVFKSQDPTSLGGKRGLEIKCNMKWARR